MIWFLSLPKWLRIAVPVLVIVVIMLAVAWLTPDRQAEQAEQTTRSSQAVSQAAENAIAKIGEQTASESNIDKAVAETTKELDHAETASQVRAIVLQRLCGQASHVSDPACRPNDGNGL